MRPLSSENLNFSLQYYSLISGNFTCILFFNWISELTPNVLVWFCLFSCGSFEFFIFYRYFRIIQYSVSYSCIYYLLLSELLLINCELFLLFFNLHAIKITSKLIKLSFSILWFSFFLNYDELLQVLQILQRVCKKYERYPITQQSSKLLLFFYST